MPFPAAWKSLQDVGASGRQGSDIASRPNAKINPLFGAVNLYDGQLVTQFSSKFDAIIFQDFLKKLLRRRPCNRRMVVICDNARYHHACALTKYDTCAI